MFLTVISELGHDQHITQHELDSPGVAVKAHLRTRGLAPFYDAGYDDDDLELISQMKETDADRGFIKDHHLESVWIWTSNTIYPSLPEPISITVVKTDRV